MSFAASPSSRIVALNRFDRGVVEISNFKGICAVTVSLDPRIRNLPMERNLAGDSTPTLKWKKVAYGGMQTGYDDSHTDESFLQQMVMNANVVRRDLLKAMKNSVSISQYICIVALVVLVWGPHSRIIIISRRKLAIASRSLPLEHQGS